MKANFCKINTSKKVEDILLRPFSNLCDKMKIIIYMSCKFVRIIIFSMQSNNMFFPYFFQNIIIIGSFLILFFVLISTLTYIFFSIFRKFESRSIILSAIEKKLNIQYILNFGVIYDKFYKILQNFK
jgi:type IV secretory pathway TrbL component